MDTVRKGRSSWSPRQRAPWRERSRPPDKSLRYCSRPCETSLLKSFELSNHTQEWSLKKKDTSAKHCKGLRSYVQPACNVGETCNRRASGAKTTSFSIGHGQKLLEHTARRGHIHLPAGYGTSQAFGTALDVLRSGHPKKLKANGTEAAGGT